MSIECVCVQCNGAILDAVVRKRRLCKTCRDNARHVAQRHQALMRKSIPVAPQLPFLSLEETAQVLHMSVEGVRVAERSALYKIRKNFPELRAWLFELVNLRERKGVLTL